MSAEIDRLRVKVVDMGRELSEERERCRVLRAELAIVKTDLDGVWLWQGDGHDHLPSLSCPVVMSAPTLRALIRRTAENMRDEAQATAARLGHGACCDEDAVAVAIGALPLPEETSAPPRGSA